MSGIVERVASEPAKSSERRRKVEHLYWVHEISMARALGFGVRRLCGSGYDKPPAIEDEVQVVGCLMPLPEPEDCQRCLRVYERYLRQRPTS